MRDVWKLYFWYSYRVRMSEDGTQMSEGARRGKAGGAGPSPPLFETEWTEWGCGVRVVVVVVVSGMKLCVYVCVQSCGSLGWMVWIWLSRVVWIWYGYGMDGTLLWYCDMVTVVLMALWYDIVHGRHGTDTTDTVRQC
jgi:hypothetical protein